MAVEIAPARLIRALLMVTALLVAAGTAVQISAHFLGHDNLMGLSREFNLDLESNTPTWFSTVALLSCAAVLAVIGQIKRSRSDPYAWYWLTLAAGFAFLSLDEAASWHETLDVLLRRRQMLGGLLQRAWVVPAILVAGALALVFARFLLHLPRRTRRQFVVAGAIYVSGCIGMEMVGAKLYSASGRFSFPYQLTAVCEEGLEMLGTILFLSALLAYMADHAGGVTFRLRG